MNFNPKARFKKVKIVILIIWKLKEFREMGEFWPNEENQVWVGDFNDEARRLANHQLYFANPSDVNLVLLLDQFDNSIDLDLLIFVTLFNLYK